MRKLKYNFFDFFGIVLKIQSYKNLLYLLGSFPLGVFYLIFLGTGLSTGLSLSIIWIGIPILVLVYVSWLAFAKFERFIVVNFLKEEIPVVEQKYLGDVGLWRYIGFLLSDPFSWKSLLFLLLKFPLGIISFGFLVVLISLSIALISLPFSYRNIQFFQISIPMLSGQRIFEITNMKAALCGTLLGMILWPITLYIAKGLTWVHANSAKMLLKGISR